MPLAIQKIISTVEGSTLKEAQSSSNTALPLVYQRVFENVNSGTFFTIFNTPIPNPQGAQGTYLYMKPHRGYVDSYTSAISGANQPVNKTVQVLANFRLYANYEIESFDINAFRLPNGNYEFGAKLFSNWMNVIIQQRKWMQNVCAVNGLIQCAKKNGITEIKVPRLTTYLTPDEARKTILSKLAFLRANFKVYADAEISGVNEEDLFIFINPTILNLLQSTTIVTGSDKSFDVITGATIHNIQGLHFIEMGELGRFWPKQDIHKSIAIDNTEADILFVYKNAFAFPNALDVTQQVVRQQTGNLYLMIKFLIAGQQENNGDYTFGKAIYDNLIRGVKFTEDITDIGSGKEFKDNQAVADHIKNKFFCVNIEVPSDQTSTSDAVTLKNAVLKMNPYLTKTDLTKFTFSSVTYTNEPKVVTLTITVGSATATVNLNVNKKRTVS